MRRPGALVVKPAKNKLWWCLKRTATVPLYPMSGQLNPAILPAAHQSLEKGKQKSRATTGSGRPSVSPALNCDTCWTMARLGRMKNLSISSNLRAGVLCHQSQFKLLSLYSEEGMACTFIEKKRTLPGLQRCTITGVTLPVGPPTAALRTLPRVPWCGTCQEARWSPPFQLRPVYLASG